MIVVVVLLTLLAALFGAAGTITLALESRLARLAPGGVDFQGFHYNPVSGTLVLEGVRALDGEGRMQFGAARLTASAGLAGLLGGGLTLRRVHVTSPTLALGRAAAADLLSLVPMPAALPAFDAPRVPRRTSGSWTIEGLVVSDGSLVVDQEAGRPLKIGNIEFRLNRLSASPDDSGATAFALEMATYGTVAQVTGSTLDAAGSGFLVRVRAADLDLATLLADLVPAAHEFLPVLRQGANGQGRADVDVAVRVADGRVLVSGTVRLGPLHVAGQGAPALRAAGVVLVLDSVDLADLTGRVSRVELLRPSIPLVLGADGRLVLPPLLRRIASAATGLVVRRWTITDGELTLASRTAGPLLALRRVSIVAQARERAQASGTVIDARAALADGWLRLTGLLAPERSTIEGELRLDNVALSLPEGRGTLAFDGRVLLDAGAAPRLTGAGRATVTALRLARAGEDALTAESATFTLRHFEWPSLRGSVDSLVLVRPEWRSDRVPAWGRWSEALQAAHVSVVQGTLRGGDADGRTLLVDVEATALPSRGDAPTQVDVVATSTDTGRVAFSRTFTAPFPTSALLEAMREATRPAAPAPPTPAPVAPAAPAMTPSPFRWAPGAGSVPLGSAPPLGSALSPPPAPVLAAP